MMISPVYSKIVRQCYYCWRRYCHCKPSNFAIQRRTARPTLDVIIKYKKTCLWQKNNLNTYSK